MTVSSKDVLNALSEVNDPNLKKDLVSLNMIRDVHVDGLQISFTVVLTTPACPLKELIRKDCLEAVGSIQDGLEIDINITSDVTSNRKNAILLPKVKNIIAVASGKGGVGKSTITANLSVGLSKTGASVGIIDADIYGPSIPTMFNCEFEQPAMKQENGKNLIIPLEQYGVQLMSIGFLTPPENAVIWRGPMASSALKQFIGDVDWKPLDYLLIDLPPGTSDIHLTLVQTLPVTGAVIVTTPQKVAIADARKGLAMFTQPQINVPVLGVVENMSYFTPSELPDNKYYIFGKDGGRTLAEQSDVPFLGEIPIVQSIRESGDVGFPAVLKDDITAKVFSQLAEEVARQVAIRNATMENTSTVDVEG